MCVQHNVRVSAEDNPGQNTGDTPTQSTAVGQAVTCAPVTQRARVRSPVGPSFLGEVLSGSFRVQRSPNIIWPSLSSSLMIHYWRQLSEMLTRPTTSNIQIHTHPIPGQKLKFLAPPGVESRPPGWKAGTLPTTPW